MQTPYGQACPFYYVNAHRRTTAREQCHLLDGTEDAHNWTSELCRTCPVPEIRRVNRCPNMKLHAGIGRRGKIARAVARLQFWRPREQWGRMVVRTTCTESGGAVSDPYVGCGRCHAPLELVVSEVTTHTEQDPEPPKEKTE
jgi:hypothetical protein